MKYKIIFGTIVVLVYKDENGDIWVLIKTRNDPGPDGIDHGKLEAMAETMKPEVDGDTFATGRRGCREELGLPELKVDLRGANGRSRDVYRFGKGGVIAKPYSTFHEVVGNKSLNADNLIGVLSEKVIPRENKESTAFRWYLLADLLLELLEDWDKFSFTYAVLYEVCYDIKFGELKL